MFFGVMLIFAILCMFVLMWVDEPATKDPGVQQEETAEQELIEGKFCPWPLLSHNNVFNIMYSCIGLILMGPNRLP
jgi:hypothetical protein